MKRLLSILIAAVMIFSLIPAVSAAEAVVITSGENVAATVSNPITYSWTATADGTLTVTMGAASPGWRYYILDSSGNTIGLPQSGKIVKSADFELAEGRTYTFKAVGFNSATWDETSANITYTLSFVPTDTSAEIEKIEYDISSTAIVVGTNDLTNLENAYTTIYIFEPTETGVFTFTAPSGSILGYWGAGSWFLSDPNSTSNTYEWTCTAVGQTAYIGISGVEGKFNLNIEKTGNYEVVEIPTVVYENKASLAPFALPDGAVLGSYIDVSSESVYSAVLGDDGYYHLNSADGDIILVDMNYQDIILSAALNSDRPVMNAYVKDENGNTIKYDIGNAILAYEEVMDENGYYPLTEDLILFYDVYANGAAVYTYYVTENYNPDNVWMYCMRTATFPEDVEPEITEPEVTEPEVTEPEVTQPEVTEPEITEPEVTEPEVTEPEVTEPAETEPAVSYPSNAELIASGTGIYVESSKTIRHTWTASSNGTLTVSMSAAKPGWRYEVKDHAGNTIGLPKSGSTAKSAEFSLTKGTTYVLTIYGWDSANQDLAAIYISYAASFISDNAGGDSTKVEKVVSAVQLQVGSNSLTLDSSADNTLFKFLPSEVGTYIITAPAGYTVGYWGATTNYLVNPNSTSNSMEWTCTSVGQAAYIGVAGTGNTLVLNIENKATEPEVTEPEVTEPEVTEPQPSEPKTTVPPVIDDNVPAGTIFAVYAADGTATYYNNASQIVSVFEAMTSGTLKLYQNVALGTNKCLECYSGTITLDLNGCTVSNSYSGVGALYVDGANVTVIDSSAAGDGLLQNTHNSGYGIQVWTGSCNFVSGNIEAVSNGLRIENIGTLNMSGGQVTAQRYGVNIMSNAVASISGGIINQTVSGSFNRTLQAASTTTVTVTGGYFNGGAVYGSTLKGKISGGYFSNSFSSNYLASGYEIQDNNDTVYLYKVINPNAQPEEPVVGVSQWNIILTDGIQANFFLTLTDDSVVKVTVADSSNEHQASSLNKSDDGLYIVPVCLAAAQMTENIKIEILIDGATVESKNYTVRQYADTILADNQMSAYHNLVKEMLNYGAAAQSYFNYNAATLANAGITGTAATDIPAATDDIAISGNVSGVQYAGATLVYRDKIAVRFYFIGEVAEITFTANGKSYEPVAKDDMYYVEIADILPQDLDTQITLTATNESGSSLNVTYGPMNYIVRMSIKGTENLQVLLKALYNYHLAAKSLSV